ncbi:DUF4385 family protein, partial [Salmonella enterica]
SERAHPDGWAFLRLCKRAGARPAGLISAAPSGILHVPVPPDGGSTRARRYANYKGGRKYAEDGSLNTRGNDPTKAAAATVFKGWWDKIRQDEDYLKRKRQHQARWG